MMSPAGGSDGKTGWGAKKTRGGLIVFWAWVKIAKLGGLQRNGNLEEATKVYRDRDMSAASEELSVEASFHGGKGTT